MFRARRNKKIKIEIQSGQYLCNWRNLKFWRHVPFTSEVFLVATFSIIHKWPYTLHKHTYTRYIYIYICIYIYITYAYTKLWLYKGLSDIYVVTLKILVQEKKSFCCCQWNNKTWQPPIMCAFLLTNLCWSQIMPHILLTCMSVFI